MPPFDVPSQTASSDSTKHPNEYGEECAVQMLFFYLFVKRNVMTLLQFKLTVTITHTLMLHSVRLQVCVVKIDDALPVYTVGVQNIII